ncbi:hypothetical protein QR680_012075 [Steinernema hermaphroditum]|uniref:Serine protease K12H4.7 n=1 Tax=Steinernema hermaphroditum TaxID=289476 RepID=A0AA39I2E3_9BILA|nr:hypothetical protein QR680_012075 [Steinernema hermaphroditum]
MNGRLALILLVVVGSALSASLNKGSTGFNRKRWLIRGRPWHGLVPPPAKADNVDAPDQWFTQPVDNFDASNTQTWQQRFWSNDQWYTEGGPIFLMLGGEGPESNGWVVRDDLEWTTLARKFGAMVYLIEHRFYGQSLPFQSAETSNLKYLSSRQALADMANFIKAQNKNNGYNNPKWIVFGGSYSGALAAWAREQYPELVYGSLASSAPVQAEVDFYQYLEVVEFAFSQTDKKCADNIHQGFVQLQKLAKTSSGRETLKNLMNICEDIDPHNTDNLHNFWQSMIGNYMGVVQYGGDNSGNYRTEVTPQAICAMVNDESSDILQRMGNVNAWFMEMYEESCVDIDYQNYLDYMKQSTDADRMWIWQTCTEFGYYQSSDSKTAGPFFGDNTKSSMPIDWIVRECAQIFGDDYKSQAVYDAIKKTNNFYGGANKFNATRVIFPNGNHDPWHALGELTSPNAQSPAIIIAGTAHCADMYPLADDDLPSLKAARKSISAHMAQWIMH